MKSIRLRVRSFIAFRNGKLGGFTKLFLLLCVFVLLGAAVPVVNWSLIEKDRKAPSDYGYGPGKPMGASKPKFVLGQVPPRPKTSAPNRAAAPAATPVGGGVSGFFGPAFPWPIIPIHIALLPDGRVLSYGTDTNGDQGALQNPYLAPNGSPTLYDIWNPTIGTGSNAHMTLMSTVTTDVFCSAVTVLASGNALVSAVISMINLIRVGADTHDFDSEQRLIPLPYTQSGTQITATL